MAFAFAFAFGEAFAAAFAFAFGAAAALAFGAAAALAFAFAFAFGAIAPLPSRAEFLRQGHCLKMSKYRGRCLNMELFNDIVIEIFTFKHVTE